MGRGPPRPPSLSHSRIRRTSARGSTGCGRDPGATRSGTCSRRRRPARPWRAPPRSRSDIRRSSIRSEDRGRLCLDRNALRSQLARRLLHDLARFISEPRGIIDAPLVLSHRSAKNSVLGSAKEPKVVQYRRQSLVERPLSPRDYDMPVGWWGWNWEPPIPMSVTELLEARNMDARTAALCGMVLEAHGSILIAAEQPHSGKTTTLTAFLDFLPIGTRRIFLRRWVETFDYLEQTKIGRAHV